MRYNRLNIGLGLAAFLVVAPGMAAAQELGATSQPQVVKRLSEMKVEAGPGARLDAAFATIAPDTLALAGPVSIRNESSRREDAILSAPVRFKEVRAAANDIELKNKMIVAKGALFYKSTFSLQDSGGQGGFDTWCGPAARGSRTFLICLGQTEEGHLLAFSAVKDDYQSGRFYARNLYETPLVKAEDKFPFPELIPVADPPADMRLELVYFGQLQGQLSFHWKLTKESPGEKPTFVWPEGLGIFDGPSAQSIENRFAMSAGTNILTFGYDEATKRATYLGAIDLKAEMPTLVTTVTRPRSLPVDATAWSAGALTFEPDSFARLPDADEAEVRVSLKAAWRQKVRLTETRTDMKKTRFEAGTIFYRTSFDGYNPVGDAFGVPGWCGPVEVTLITGKSQRQTCFADDNINTATAVDYSGRWPLLMHSALASGYTLLLPVLPAHETVTAQPEDAQTVTFSIRRTGKREVRIKALMLVDGQPSDIVVWEADFAKDRQMILNLWGKRIRLTPKGETGLDAIVDDAGDGKGLGLIFEPLN